MLNNEAQAATGGNMLNAVSAANSAATQSSWIDVRGKEGDIMVLINTGAITGSFTPAFEDATDNTGTGSATVTPNEGAPAVINTANQSRKYTFRAGALRGFLRHAGTVVTGPVLVAVSYQARPKNF